MHLTDSNVLVVNRKALVAAFEAWRTDQRLHPGEFEAPDELDVREAAELDVDTLLTYVEFTGAAD